MRRATSFLIVALAVFLVVQTVWGASQPSVVPPSLLRPSPTVFRPTDLGLGAEGLFSSGIGGNFEVVAAAVTQSTPPPSEDLPPAPKLSAKAAVLMDADTGRLLFARNPHERRSPASLTKIVTGIVAIAEGDLDSMAKVSANAASKPPTKLGLKAGDRIRLSDLLAAAVMGSSNDAATVVAEHVGGSEAAFARSMTQMAHKLGARNSNFVNPHGLDASKHYSTAYDMAVLSGWALRVPEIARLATQRRVSVTWEGGSSEVANINSFLWRYSGAFGLKTGYTSSAGHCVSVAAQREGHRLIVVVMGCPSSEARWNDAIVLMDYGFENFAELTKAAGKPHRLYVVRPGDTLSSIARQCGTTVAILLNLNPSLQGNPNLIKVGQQLVVP